MSIAADFGAIIKILVNDSDLKELMDIPVASRTDYKVLIEKYFLQTMVSDEFTNDGICRLLVRNAPQRETNNDYVKWDGLIIEVYVPKSKDLTTGFQTRINQISDRLITLFNRNYINDNKLYFVNSFELTSRSNNFKRYVCTYEYKKIYK